MSLPPARQRKDATEDGIENSGMELRVLRHRQRYGSSRTATRSVVVVMAARLPRRQRLTRRAVRGCRRMPAPLRDSAMAAAFLFSCYTPFFTPPAAVLHSAETILLVHITLLTMNIDIQPRDIIACHGETA